MSLVSGPFGLDPPGPIRAAAMLHEQLVAYGDDVTSEWKAGTIRYSRAGKLFVIVKPLAKRVDVGFNKIGLARNKRILTAPGRLPFVRHVVTVEAPGDLDSQLQLWLRESYENAE